VVPRASTEKNLAKKEDWEILTDLNRLIGLAAEYIVRMCVSMID